jgi:DNA-binding response OmpR family regulator
VPATRLLIVEDSELTAGALRLLFQERGFDVSVAPDITTAVTVATEWKPDVMLLDLTLADGDGLDVLRKLRSANALPGSTVALTGHDDDQIRQRCLDAGCVEVLLKPVPIARLLELVRSL